MGPQSGSRRSDNTCYGLEIITAACHDAEGAGGGRTYLGARRGGGGGEDGHVRS